MVSVLVVEVVVIQNFGDGGDPVAAVGVAQLHLSEAVLIIEEFYNFAHQVGLAHAGHSPQIDDHRAVQDFRHQVQDLEVFQDTVNDGVDTDEISFQVVPAGSALVLSGLDYSLDDG